MEVSLLSCSLVTDFFRQVKYHRFCFFFSIREKRDTYFILAGPKKLYFGIVTEEWKFGPLDFSYNFLPFPPAL